MIEAKRLEHLLIDDVMSYESKRETAKSFEDPLLFTSVLTDSFNPLGEETLSRESSAMHGSVATDPTGDVRILVRDWSSKLSNLGFSITKFLSSVYLSGCFRLREGFSLSSTVPE